MGRRYKIALGVLLAVAIIGVASWYFSTQTVAVLDTEGTIASQQRRLIYISLLLSVVVVVPVYIMLGLVVTRYRHTNRKAKYEPNFDHSRLIEGIWWGVPTILILILSVIAWRSSHDLDPYKPLESTTRPITIQVVALQWKWLFIYPEHGGVATVNYLQIPEKTPINFQITSDAPMNSFWIPQLGGQVYAMSGMSTKLHLMADKVGTYEGSSANISGEGFAGMRFQVESRAKSDFNAWIEQVSRNYDVLGQQEYSELAKPSRDIPPSFYGASKSNLYDTIVTKYMTPTKSKHEGEHNEHGEY